MAPCENEFGTPALDPDPQNPKRRLGDSEKAFLKCPLALGLKIAQGII